MGGQRRDDVTWMMEPDDERVSIARKALAKAEDGLKRADMQRLLGGCSNSTARRAIRALEDEGVIRREGVGRATRYYYRDAPSATQVQPEAAGAVFSEALRRSWEAAEAGRRDAADWALIAAAAALGRDMGGADYRSVAALIGSPNRLTD